MLGRKGNKRGKKEKKKKKKKGKEVGELKSSFCFWSEKHHLRSLASLYLSFWEGGREGKERRVFFYRNPIASSQLSSLPSNFLSEQVV